MKSKKKILFLQLWQWLRENFTRISTWYTFRLRFQFFYIVIFKKILTRASGKNRKKNSRYAVSRYAVTSLPVTPLRVFLTTDAVRITDDWPIVIN